MVRTLTCCLVLLAPGPVLAQEWEITPDVIQTYEARKALLRDPVLGPLNLGVKVKKRVAVLWGPVPSADIGRRAVSLLEKLPGLVAVRNDLDIDPELNFPQWLPETLPQESRAPWLPRDIHLSPATLTTRSLEKPIMGAVGGQAPFSAPEDNSLMPKKVPDPFPPPAVVVPPTTIPGMPDHREMEIVLPSLRIPVEDPEVHKTPAEAIAALQKDSRFAHIQVRLEAGIATLSADDDQVQLLYELARRISAIPGIDRVVVQEKR